MSVDDQERFALTDVDDQHLSIGEVLEQLRDEFPDVTISKIRFLESQGLIDPERTPSGYRKFSDGDLERLRWILLQQRDHFLPLRVIKDRLDSFGRSGAPKIHPSPTRGATTSSASTASPASSASTASTASPTPPPRRQEPPPVPKPPPFETDAISSGEDDDEVVGATDAEDVSTEDEFTRAELLEASGLTDLQLDALEDHGLLEPVVGAGERALYDESSLDIASIAAGFYARGIEARHLKMYKHFSEREGALFAQVLRPYVRQRNPDAKARLQEELEELARLGRRLRTATLRQALRDDLTE